MYERDVQDLTDIRQVRGAPDNIEPLCTGVTHIVFVSDELLAVGQWFPPGTPVSSTRKLISSYHFTALILPGLLLRH